MKNIDKEKDNKGRCRIDVRVKWLDGCKQEFECKDFRTCDGILVLELRCEHTKYIPLSHVRWYCVDENGHKEIIEVTK